MNEFKTQDELLEHYWSVIVPMARDHVINPWECVLSDGREFDDHPRFIEGFANYTFALTVLEGKPVFYSDKIYSKSGETFNWNDSEYRRQLTMKGLKITTVWTWTPPPTKKRTFMFGDKEFPMFMDKPVNSIHAMDISCRSSGSSPSFHSIYFDTAEEMIEVFNGFREYLIDTARDKE